jgi:hypothetical protein
MARAQISPQIGQKYAVFGQKALRRSPEDGEYPQQYWSLVPISVLPSR